MTIDLQATHPATTQFHDELLQFVFRSAVSSGLLKNARAMLDAAPKELVESFEQAMRNPGLES